MPRVHAVPLVAHPGPDRTGEAWTPQRTRKEAFATILAACWYRQRFTFLLIEVGLSKVMTTFRWDLSSNWVIMDPGGPVRARDAVREGQAALSRLQPGAGRQLRAGPAGWT